MLRLVRHDLLIVRNSFLAAFSSLRDWLTLLLALALGTVVARSFLLGVATSGLDVSAWSCVAYFAIVGFLTHLYSAHRIAHLSEESAMAAFALSTGPRRAYHGAWLAAILAGSYLPIILLYGPTGERVLAIALIGGWLPLFAGAVAGALWQAAVPRLRRALQRRWLGETAPRRPPLDAGGHRLSRLVAITVRRQSLVGRSTGQAAALLAGAGFGIGLAAFGISRILSAFEGLAVAALMALAAMLVISRLSAGLMRYLAFVGYEPLAPGVAPVAGMALFLASLTLSLALLLPAWTLPASAVAAGVLLVFAVFTYMRSLHYRLRSERAADFTVQM